MEASIWGALAYVHSGGVESQSLTPLCFYLPFLDVPHTLSLSPQARPPFYLQARPPSFYPQASPPFFDRLLCTLTGLELTRDPASAVLHCS